MLADVGLSKLLSGSKRYFESRAGTDLYKALELKNAQVVKFSFEADMWSAGILFYYILTKRFQH